MTLWIEIQEQPERRRYFAQVELGGLIARRKEVTSPRDDGFDGILNVVRETYYEMNPDAEHRANDLAALVECEVIKILRPLRGKITMDDLDVYGPMDRVPRAVWAALAEEESGVAWTIIPAERVENRTVVIDNQADPAPKRRGRPPKSAA